MSRVIRCAWPLKTAWLGPSPFLLLCPPSPLPAALLNLDVCSWLRPRPVAPRRRLLLAPPLFCSSVLHTSLYTHHSHAETRETDSFGSLSSSSKKERRRKENARSSMCPVTYSTQKAEEADKKNKKQTKTKKKGWIKERQGPLESDYTRTSPRTEGNKKRKKGKEKCQHDNNLYTHRGDRTHSWPSCTFRNNKFNNNRVEWKQKRNR